MAQITDKISKVTDGSARPVTTTVDAGRSVGTKTLICKDLTGWDESTISFFVTYEKDASGKVVKGTQTDFVGIRSGNTMNSIQVTGGSDRGNKVGDIVQQLPTSEFAKRQAEAFLKSHNQDGSLTNDAVTTASIKNSSVTKDKIADKAITSDKIDFQKSVDANGWTVYDYGNWKEYIKNWVYENPTGVTIPGYGVTDAGTGTTKLPIGISSANDVTISCEMAVNDRVLFPNAVVSQDDKTKIIMYISNWHSAQQVQLKYYNYTIRLKTK